MPEPDAVAASRRQTTRILFVASVFVLPMPFYLVFDLALVPLAFTVVWFVRPLFLAPFKGQTFGALVGLAPFLALHVAIDGGLLYLATALVSRLLLWLASPRIAQRLVAVLIAAGIVASSLPIYTVMDPNSSGANPRLDVVNAADAWREFILEERHPAPR